MGSKDLCDLRASEKFDFVLEAAGRLGVFEQDNGKMRSCLLEWSFSSECLRTAWRTKGKGSGLRKWSRRWE